MATVATRLVDILPIVDGRFAGLPNERWLFALRMWLAVNLALGVAFWVELKSADTAGVIVALLAMQTRGQAFEKGAYLFLATAVGGIMSVAIVSLFAQTRDLYITVYAGWLAVCVFAAGFFDGNRAYGAVVCGYTVSVVAIIPFDQPTEVFSGVVNRCAAIAIGIVSVLLVVDVFRGAEIGPSLIARLGRGCGRARAFTDALLKEGATRDKDVGVAAALKTVSLQHPLLNAVPVEAVSGTARAGAMRATLSALAGEIFVARNLAAAERADPPAGDRELQALVLRRMQNDLDARRTEATLAFAAARDGRRLDRPPRMPIYRPWQGALLNAVRAFVGSVLVAALFVLLGWSKTSFTLAMVGVIMCFAANAPDPRAMTRGAIVAIPAAVVLGGVTEFLVLGGVDAFPLLMLGLAPALFGSLLLTSSPNPGVSSVGLLLGVFTIVSISPNNPQQYDPQSYVVTAMLLPLAAALAFILVRVLFPTSDAQRRRWLLASSRRDMLAALRGSGCRRSEDETRLLDASRIATFAMLRDVPSTDLATALHMADLARVARRIWRALLLIAGGNGTVGITPEDMQMIRAALLTTNAGALRRSARALADGDDSALPRLAGDLAWAAALVDALPVSGSIEAPRAGKAAA